jgi:hypothetical protein
MRDRSGMKIIDADVPLAELFGYATSASLHDPRPRQLLDRILPLLGRSKERGSPDRRGQAEIARGSWLVARGKWQMANSK